MSTDSEVAENQITGDGLGEFLAGVVRLLDGAIAAAFIPRTADHSPIVWADLAYADVATGLHAIAVQHFDDRGPWGAAPAAPAAPAGGAGAWAAWVEPAAAHGDGDREEGSAGVLAVAFRDRDALSQEEITTVQFFARMCGTVTEPLEATAAGTLQRRLDELVSVISERLMSTVGPTLQAALDWSLESLCRFLGADVAFLRRNDHALGVSILMAEYPRREVPLDQDPLGIVPFDADLLFAATKDLKVPLIVRNSADADERYLERVRQAGYPFDFTGAAVPLVHGDTSDGILAFVYLSAYAWSDREVHALRALAALIVQLLHRIDAEERLRKAAQTDDLTGLPNRRALLDEVGKRQRAGGDPLALLFIDLDRFKVMNDHLGHEAGDRVLQVIADRIRTSLRPFDFAARLGGDEFVVVLEDEDGGLSAAAAANRLLDLISLPIEVGDQSVAHTGSIGIALSQSPEATAEDLLGQADIALYAAKSQGRNRTVVFDHELKARVAQRSSIELLLRQALAEHALRVLYQPEFDLRDGRLLSVEALVRWERPGHGLVDAAQFVPVAEETHLINDIDRWVLETACMQAAAWHRSVPGVELVMRVNLSPGQLAITGVVRSVADSLRSSGLPPHLLCLEITEQAVIADVDQTVRVLHDIRAMGVKLAIDDFGTGFSSMSQLRSLPVDTLKIDRVFVDGIARDPTDQAIVETIVRLARAFKLDVVGEGVERTEDMETLVRIGCLRAQGYLLSRPLPADQLRPILEHGGIDLSELADSIAP